MITSRLLLTNILLTGALYVGGFVALGDSFPTIESTGTDIIEWFSNNGTSARAYAWTGAFVSLGLAIFGGQVAAKLPKPHRYIFLAGAIGCAVTAQVQAWFWAGLTLSPQDLDPATARTLFAIPTFWGPLVNASTATMAIAIAALGTGAAPMIPRWLFWLSSLFFLEQVIETVTIFGHTGFIAPGGPMNVYLGGIIGFTWIAGTVRWAISQTENHPG